MNELYAAQETEVQKAEREREKRDAIDKANSSAHSDGSVKSSSIRLRKTRAPKVRNQFILLSCLFVCLGKSKTENRAMGPGTYEQYYYFV